MRSRNLFFVILIFFPNLSFAQNGYFSDWFARVDKTKDEQPHWVTPLATTTPRLEEEYRYDQTWQENAKGVTTDSYDGGKGLELIPFEKVEVIFNLPPYIDHNNPKVQDGWGDVAFLVKYRLLSANEQHGNYILTAFLGWSLAHRPIFERRTSSRDHARPSPTEKVWATSISRAPPASDSPPLTPVLSVAPSLGTTPSNIAFSESSGPRSNSIPHFFRTARTTARNRISLRRD